MKIIFNPYYGERQYVQLFNATIAGKSGLLSELELRAGLTGVHPTHTERIVAYIKAAQKAIELDGSLFFKNSFEGDKLGTAEVLLGWRDSLVYAGWTKDIAGTEKLRGLASVECCFQSDGEADRWRRLLVYAEEHLILKADDEIEVTASKEHLDMTLQQLFDCIEKKGTAVAYGEAVGTQMPTCTMSWHFHTDIEAHTWMAQQRLALDDMVAGFDNAVLADLAHALNLPSVTSQETGVGLQMQMLSLGVALFKKPVDVQTLLDYLQLPMSPLRTVYNEYKYKAKGEKYLRPLSEDLKGALLDGGMGEVWKEKLTGPFCDYKHNTVEKNKCDLVLSFINMWDKSESDDKKRCVVPKSDVEEYVGNLRKWSAQQQRTASQHYAQFGALISACDKLLLLLETQAEKILADELIEWTRQIVEPVVLLCEEAQVGSHNVVSSPADICCKVNNLYWLCVLGAAPSDDPYDFLSHSDWKCLADAQIKLPQKGYTSMCRQEEMLRGLSRAQQIYMITCDICHGEAAAMDGVAMMMSPQQTEGAIKYVSQKVVGLPTPQSTYHIDAPKIAMLEQPKSAGGLRREVESYSSLNLLIQSPFEYVLQYMMNMPAYESKALSDINTVKGNVAHKYIECLTENNGNDPQMMNRKHQEKYDELFNQVVESDGILLLQENNRLDLMRLKAQLKKSVNELLNIITNNNLKIVGAEQVFEVDIDVIGKMYAKIDYLLETADQKLVVIDFKWNERNTYNTKLEKNRALQLAVYKNILEKSTQKDVVFCGYYILPKYKLLTRDSVLSGESVEVITTEDHNDIFEQAKNSYKYRMEQLKQGVIEEGEKMPLADIQYYTDMVSCNLYPLENDYSNDEIKGAPYGEPNKVLKGRLS